jgi:hypothetical protein
MDGASEVASMMYERVCRTADYRNPNQFAYEAIKEARTYDFFLGPSCKAPGRFLPTGEFSSDDIINNCCRVQFSEEWG